MALMPITEVPAPPPLLMPADLEALRYVPFFTMIFDGNVTRAQSMSVQWYREQLLPVTLSMDASSELRKLVIQRCEAMTAKRHAQALESRERANGFWMLVGMLALLAMFCMAMIHAENDEADIQPTAGLAVRPW